MKFPRVLAGSEDFFAGLQHPDSPVQIRSAPLVRRGRNTEKQCFSLFYVFEYQDRSECGNIIVNVCKIGMDAASHVEGAPGRKSGDSGSVVC